jgi:hypothetical protein
MQPRERYMGARQGRLMSDEQISPFHFDLLVYVLEAIELMCHREVLFTTKHRG